MRKIIGVAVVLLMFCGGAFAQACFAQEVKSPLGKFEGAVRNYAYRSIDDPPVSPEDYRKNIKEITDKLLADYLGSIVVLQRPIWYSENTKNSSTYLLEGQVRTMSYALELESLAGFYRNTSDGDRVFLGDMKAFHYFKTHHEAAMKHEDQGNGVFFLHPNDRGADVLGRFWGAAILKSFRFFR